MAMVFWLLKHFREFINFHKKQQQQTHLKPNKNSNKIILCLYTSVHYLFLRAFPGISFGTHISKIYDLVLFSMLSFLREMSVASYKWLPTRYHSTSFHSQLREEKKQTTYSDFTWFSKEVDKCIGLTSLVDIS